MWVLKMIVVAHSDVETLQHPDYAMQNWHQTLLMIGIASVATLFNTIGAKHLPLLEWIVLAFHILGFFCIIIPLWVVAPKAPTHEVFYEFDNFGGWSTIGAACYAGSITATGSFAGSDAAAHLSEETNDASKAVPRMIMGTVLLNGAMGLVFIITYVSRHQASTTMPMLTISQCYCITSLDIILGSESPFPCIDV
jgi:choline transport protein